MSVAHLKFIESGSHCQKQRNPSLPVEARYRYFSIGDDEN